MDEGGGTEGPGGYKRRTFYGKNNKTVLIMSKIMELIFNAL